MGSLKTLARDSKKQETRAGDYSRNACTRRRRRGLVVNRMPPECPPIYNTPVLALLLLLGLYVIIIIYVKYR